MAGRGQKGGGQKPPKKQKGGATSGGGAGDDVKNEHKLQAVILADSFNTTFRPVSFNHPKVLMPLVNVPMLEYTLEFLVQNGVEEVIVYCSSGAQQITKYVENSLWNDVLPIRCISSRDCSSAGDALRDLDNRNLIRSNPFVLISGDVVANFDLRRAIASHKANAKKDPETCLTTVLRRAPATDSTRPLNSELLVGMNRRTGQIVMYDDDPKVQNVALPWEIMANYNTGTNLSELTITAELSDCGVDICGPELLLQFSDNFDYHHIRSDFIRNEATNFSMGKHLYAHILGGAGSGLTGAATTGASVDTPTTSLVGFTGEYAARVEDIRGYAAVSRDIIQRWTYPLVPDSALLATNNYRMSGGWRYQAASAVVSRRAKIGESVVLGCEVAVGDDAVVSHSVLGSGVIVGLGASVVNSYVWDGAEIGSGVKLTNAVICNGAKIGANAVITEGCVIGHNCVVAPNAVLPPFSRVVLESDIPEDDNTGTLIPLEGVIEGSGWVVLPTEVSDDSDEELEVEEVISSGEELMRATSIGAVCNNAHLSKWSDMPLPAEKQEQNEDDHATAIQPPHIFCASIAELVLSGVAERNENTSMLLEIRSLKLSQNRPYAFCLRGVMIALLYLAEKAATTINGRLMALMKMLEPGAVGDVLRDLIQSEMDQLAIIVAVEDFLLGAKEANKAVRGDSVVEPAKFIYIAGVLRALLQAEIVENEGFEFWTMERSNEEEDMEEMEGYEDYEDDDEEEDDDEDAICMGYVSNMEVEKIEPEDEELEARRQELFVSKPIQEFIEYLNEEEESDEEESDEEEESDDE